MERKLKTNATTALDEIDGFTTTTEGHTAGADRKNRTGKPGKQVGPNAN